MRDQRTAGTLTAWSRRRLLGAGAVGMAGAVAAACAPGGRAGGTQAGGGDKPSEIEYWHGWTGAQYDGPEGMIAKIIGLFNQKHPNVTVRASYTTWNDIPGKLTTAAAGGTPPEVVMANNSDGKLYSYANTKLVQPLEKVAPAAELRRLKEWLHPSIWDLGVFEGKVYGLAMWTQSYCLLYNKAHFREVGLDPSRGPQTLDELAAYAEKLTKRDASAPGGYARLGFYHTGLNHFLPGFGGQLVDASGKKITANHPNNLKALEWLAGWFRRYDVDRINAFRSSSGSLPQGDFAAEKFSMAVDGPWRTRTIKLLAPGMDYGVSYLPSPADQPGLGCYTYGDIPVVPAGAKQADGAWKYVQFLTGFGDETGGAEMHMYQPQTPTSEKGYKAGAYKKVQDAYPGYDLWAKALFDAKRFLFPPKIPTAKTYGDLLGKYVADARDGKITPREALDRLTQEAQAELDQALAGGR